MSSLCKALWPLGGALCLAWCAPLLADNPAPDNKTVLKKVPPSSFVRVKRDAKDQPVALETATVRYVSGAGTVTVDLVGVVHVGDRAYYEQLNKQLDQYDVLLYELVAPQGTRVPKGGARKSNNPISMLQGLMKSVLDLELQMEHIDYTRKHFVHADLSPDELYAEMQKRGETGLSLVLSIAADMIRQQGLQEMKRKNTPNGKEDDLDVLSLLLDPQASVKLKRMMAQQLADMDSPDGGLGQTLNNILVVDRNKAALKVFQKQLDKGRKKIGIFYGAAHMPDFERRLLAEYGMRRQSQQWLQAWDLEGKSSGPSLLKLLGS